MSAGLFAYACLADLDTWGRFGLAPALDLPEKVCAMIREASESDVEAIVGIYNRYVEATAASFEEEPLSVAQMERRIERVRKVGFPWLVAEGLDGLVGYAYASKWNPRAAYRHTAEVSVYVHEAHRQRGWGSRLYEAVLADLRKRGIRIAIGGITLPNPGSVALHEKFGMKKVAHFEEVGWKFGQWRDVGYWQVRLDPSQEARTE